MKLEGMRVIQFGAGLASGVPLGAVIVITAFGNTPGAKMPEDRSASIYSRYEISEHRGHGGAGRILFIPATPASEPPRIVSCPSAIAASGLCVEVMR